MSDNLQNLLRESLLNNSYDYGSMHNVLRMAWENSYSYLYDLQKNYVEFEDLEYISNDTDKDLSKIGRLYNDKLLRACFDVNYDFIHVCDREEFHNSEFYFNEFTFYDMVDNPSIFKKIPIIMIDGQCIWDYKLRIHKKIISVILPFKRDFVISLERNPETDELIYLDHNIRVLVVDNLYYVEFKTKGIVQFYSDPNGIVGLPYYFTDYNLHTDTYDKNKHYLNLNVSNILRSNRLDIDDGLFVVTINKITNNKKNLKEFFSSGILIPKVQKDEEIIINRGINNNSNTGNYVITCSFQLGEELYQNLVNEDLSNDYMIHLLYVNKLRNYSMPLYRHKTSYEWYLDIDGASPDDLRYGNTSGKRISRDIVCDENGECNVFMLQRKLNYTSGPEMSRIFLPYAMPIPVEDLIVIKFDRDDNPTLMINTKTVKLYYPNIYRIIDPDRQPGDRYQVSYFYHNATFLEYTPIHEYFYRFLQIRYNEAPIEDIIDYIYRGVADFSSFTEDQLAELKATFKKIMEYQYYNHQYGDVDFVKRYIQIPENIDKKEVEYKDEILKEWIRVNQYLLRDYVIEQDKLYAPIYHLWTNTLDLSKRLRTDTNNELGEYGYELEDEYYMFAFRNEETVKNSLLLAHIFVDGIHVDDVIHERYQFTDFFYIPVDLVTNDSYIEIEIFPSYKYGTRIEFESMEDSKTISLLEPADSIFPTAQDLFYMEPSGHLIADEYNTKLSSTDALGNKDTIEFTTKQTMDIRDNNREYWDTTIYSNELFDITAKYKDGNFLVKTIDPDKPVKFTRLSTFEIKPANELVLNKDLYVGISKIPNYINYEIDREGYPYIALIENKFKFNIEYLRIFVNGRLLPRQKYCFFSSFFFPRIQFTDYMYPGDVIHIDITPYRYKEIYYQKDLEFGKTLINLKGIITKPFDIRYYDVYMNGRKLGLNSVWTISPWEITLTNLMSLHNLQIFEKERDWEYFGINYNEYKYYYSIDDLFDSSFITEEEKNQIIKEMIEEAKEPECNIKPPVDDEDPIDYTDDRQYPHVNEFYFNELIPKTIVDPDTKQFDDDIMKEEYTTIDDVYRVHPVDSYRTENERERRENYVDALSLNPDVYIEGQNEENLQYVYCVGHIEDVDSEMLSQVPTNLYNKEGIDNAD